MAACEKDPGIAGIHLPCSPDQGEGSIRRSLPDIPSPKEHQLFSAEVGFGNCLICFFMVGIFLGSYFFWMYRSLFHQRSLMVLELALCAAPPLCSSCPHRCPPSLVWLSSPGLPALWPGNCLPAESPETVAPLLISLLQGPQWCWLSSVRKITHFVWFSSCLNKENESSPCYYLLAWNRFLGFTISLVVLRGFGFLP